MKKRRRQIDVHSLKWRAVELAIIIVTGLFTIADLVAAVAANSAFGVFIGTMLLFVVWPLLVLCRPSRNM